MSPRDAAWLISEADPELTHAFLEFHELELRKAIMDGQANAAQKFLKDLSG